MHRPIIRLALATLFLLPLTACPRPAPSTPPAAQDPGIAARVSAAMTAAKVRVALLDKLGSDALGIDVTIDGDRARLSGTVDKRSSQELAEEVARSVDGVRRVSNDVALKRAGGGDTPVGSSVGNVEREVRDALLESRVKSNLLGEIGRHALEIEVECTDGVTSLRGWVPDRSRKRLALDAARDTAGVAEVVDLIRVGLQ